jgi:hypothetical protein
MRGEASSRGKVDYKYPPMPVRTLSSAALWVVLAACGGAVPATPVPAAPAPSAQRAAPDACPLTVDGVRANIESTGRGVAVTLTAAPDQLMLLRARAHAVADLDGGLLAACPCGAPPPTAPPASTVTVDDLEGGARVEVSAKDPTDARALRQLVRTHLGLVHGGGCPAR